MYTRQSKHASLEGHAMPSITVSPPAEGKRRRTLREAVEALGRPILPLSDDEPLQLDVAQLLRDHAGQEAYLPTLESPLRALPALVALHGHHHGPELVASWAAHYAAARKVVA